MLISAFQLQDAYDVTDIKWHQTDVDTTKAILNSGNASSNNPSVTLCVTDSLLVGGRIDTINVVLTSTTGDTITLILTEDGSDNGSQNIW